MTPIGLYIHIPFCQSICSYCNFNRGLFDGPLKDRYLRALREEIRLVAAQVDAGRHPVTGRPLQNPVMAGYRDAPASVTNSRDGAPRGSSRLRADTIYFGGGTPSLLSPDEIGAVIEACRSAFDVSDDAEVTLEANPETVTVEKTAAYRAAGVNRVSMGVQSFRDEELRRLERVHNAARAREALSAVRAGGIENVSLDLMLWLPQQTVEDCLFSVRALAGLRPQHASLYLLELYPNSPRKEEMARSGWSLAPDEDAADMYLGARDILTGAGYDHYEISNFAQPGYECRHNLKSWRDGDWLAFGCGAHSTIDGVRWKNVSATDVYVRGLESGQAPVVAERRELTPDERLQEAIFMGLRLASGIDVGDIERRYGVDLWQRYGERLTPFVDAGLLVAEPPPGNGIGDEAGTDRPETLRLSPRGLLLSNEVMTVFIEDTVR